MSEPIDCYACGSRVDPGKHYDDRTCPPCAESLERELDAYEGQGAHDWVERAVADWLLAGAEVEDEAAAADAEGGGP